MFYFFPRILWQIQVDDIWFVSISNVGRISDINGFRGPWTSQIEQYTLPETNIAPEDRPSQK